MPKISLHVEADSPDEFLELLSAFTRNQVQGFVPKDDGVYAEAERREDTATEELITIAKDFVAQEAKKWPPAPVLTPEEPDQPPAEIKPARKPRGPNKPKMAPVTEEAPEEVEHVGTVAVSTDAPASVEQGNGKDEVLTRMDLGDTIAGYVRKYGINFAQTDVSKMLQDMFGADVRKKSDVPDDQKSLRQAIATITQATIDNPYNRKVDVNG